MNIEQIKETPVGTKIVQALNPQRAEEVLNAIKVAGDAMNWSDSFGEFSLHAERVSGVFVFEDTPQGHTFWAKIHDEVEGVL